MTSIVAIAKQDGVTFFTDGAAFDQDGCMVFELQKAEILLHYPAIIAMKGKCEQSAMLRCLCDLFARSGFDGLVDSIPMFLGEVARRASEPPNVMAVLGGWSDRSLSWEVHYAGVSGASADQLDIEPYITKIAGGHFFDPEPPREMLVRHALVRDGVLDLRGGDEAFIRYFECQRATKFLLGRPGSPTGCITGGFLQKTTLTGDEATTSIIHRWPDEVGQLLGREHVSVFVEGGATRPSSHPAD